MLAFLKLQNGTEVIGNIRDDEETKMVLEDPMQINYRLVSTQPMPTVSISRYMPFALEKRFVFEKKDLLHIVKPKQAMVEYYNHALKNYREMIDKYVEEELINATKNRFDFGKEEEDTYQALLEKLNYKGRLN